MTYGRLAEGELVSVLAGAVDDDWSLVQPYDVACPGTPAPLPCPVTVCLVQRCNVIAASAVAAAAAR